MNAIRVPKRFWPRMGWGVILTLGAIAAVELLSHTIYRPPTLTILLAVVAYVAFRWGRRASLVSASLVSLYGAYYYAFPAHILENLPGDALRLGALLATSVIVALLVGDLRQAVRASEERLRRELEFRSALDNSMGEGVYALDREGFLTFMNPAAERLLGWTEAEIRGRVMHDVIHFQHADGSPLPRKQCRGLNSVLQSGVAYRTEDDVFTRKDGQIFPVAYSAAPIRVDGQVSGIVVVFHDRTERERAEHALQARACQQAAVAELGRQALAIRDHTVLMNQAVQLIADTLGVRYTRIMELLPDRQTLLLRAGIGWDADLVGRATFEAEQDSFAGYTLRSKAPVIALDLRHETRFRVAALQRERQIVSSVSVIVDGRDQPFGVLCVDATEPQVFSDDDVHFLQAIAHVITAALQREAFERDLIIERDATERLTELDRLRTEFIGSVSHDLRTPLTAARAGLGLIETSAGSHLAPNERQLLCNVRRNIERLRMLIDDLLALNQVEAGAVRLDCEPLDLRTVVVDALAEVQPLMRQKEQPVELDLPEPLPIAGDAPRLLRVVMNLLANAHQHTPSRTRITITGWVERGDVRLALRDTGPGIPPGELEAIFQRFHRLGAPNTGSGLGLAIARGIVELHHGRIWAESEPGAGATFQIALPRALDASGQLTDLATEA